MREKKHTFYVEKNNFNIYATMSNWEWYSQSTKNISFWKEHILFHFLQIAWTVPGWTVLFEKMRESSRDELVFARIVP